MSFASEVKKLVAGFRRQRPIRAGSLIITAYGDAIAPRGGTVWLGSLIRIAESFGLSQRLVRTSVHRLAQDDWLASEQIGRRSDYSLTETGRQRFEEATRRIYAPPLKEWDHKWCLVVLPPGRAEVREALRKELKWLGFGAFTPGVMAHPAPDMQAVVRTIRECKADEEPVVMQAAAHPEVGADAIRVMAESSWHLPELGERYAGFLKRFRPVLKAANSSRKQNPELCLQARILLIHEYRKILLRDPHLPTELLPGKWTGNAAYSLCRNLYRTVYRPAEEYLSEVLETAEGPLPEPAHYFYQRFGGLA